VRDKVAGAKRKGKYTGGTSLLGYDSDLKTHKLIINPLEAKTVQHVFKRYAETGSGQLIARELNAAGITTK
jgi:site-specific DNA recombinase